MTDPNGSLLPVGFLIHADASLHDTGWGHPEHQGRLRAIASSVGQDLLALDGRVIQVEPESIEDEEFSEEETKAIEEELKKLGYD